MNTTISTIKASRRPLEEYAFRYWRASKAARRTFPPFQAHGIEELAILTSAAPHRFPRVAMLAHQQLAAFGLVQPITGA